MRVSILIPTLNRKAFLTHALTTAREQTKSAHEILVSDDGSTDGTREYVASVAARDARVRLLTSNPSPGIFTNINHLVAESSGDAFCILGDDDRLAPEYLERLSEPLASHPDVVASFCDHRIIDAGGHVLAEATESSSKQWGRASLAPGIVPDPLGIALAPSLCIGFALFRSAALAREPFDLLCGHAADVDYTIRAAGLGTFYYVPLALGDYRHHPGTATQTRAIFMAGGQIRALKKHHFVGAHEQLRVARLKRALLSHAVLVATSDRHAALSSLREFLGLGGSPANLRVVLSGIAAMTPRPLAQRVESLLRTAQRQVRALPTGIGATPRIRRWLPRW